MSSYKDFLRHSGERDARGVRNPKFGERISDFGSDLKGLGGLSTSRIRALRGSKLGPASEGRKLSPEERKRIEEQMRKDGKL